MFAKSLLVPVASAACLWSCAGGTQRDVRIPEPIPPISERDASVPDAVDAGRDADPDASALPPTPPGSQRFTVWAPHADAVELVGSFTDEAPRALEPAGDGTWFGDVKDVAANDLYHFVVRREQESLVRVDPRALGFDEATGRSRVAELSAADARELGFVRPALDEAVIYELHAGTFAASGPAVGTFADVSSGLDRLLDLGVNVIELMPVHEFPGQRSWGYNPDLLYAVETSYGGPEGLRALIREAHTRGIAVVLDVVYNHLNGRTPLCRYDGWSLLDECGGVYFYNDARGLTDWGPRPDFGRKEVRAYLRGSVESLLDQFRLDGLRFDSTSNIWNTRHGEGVDLPDGARVLRELNDVMHARGANYLSIAEDLHAGALATDPTSEDGYGFDSQWDPGFHARLRNVLTRAENAAPSVQEVAAAVGGRLGKSVFSRVIYTESHDTTGKLNGHVRLPDEIEPGEPAGARARRRSLLGALTLFTSPGVPMILQGQELLADGTFHDDAPLDWTRLSAHGDVLAQYRALIALRRNLAGKTAGLRGASTRFSHVNAGAGVLGYVRAQTDSHGLERDEVLVLLNYAARAFTSYRVGVPRAGTWHVRFDGRSGTDNLAGSSLESEPVSCDGMPHSLLVPLAPEAGLILSM